MYCKHCGREIGDDQRFCSYCGARQQEEGQVLQVERSRIGLTLAIRN